MNIGQKIKYIRENKGYTQETLSEMLGISRSMVAQIERGAKTPNLLLGYDLARVLGCKMEDFVVDSDRR